MSSHSRLRVEALEAREVPAGDLAYALQLTGLSAAANVRVATDPIGNTYVAGAFSGTIDLDPTAAGVANVVARGGTDVFVAKYGVAGNLIWAKAIGGTANETASDIAFDGAGNVYVGGTFTGAVDFNPDPAATAVLQAAEGGSGFVCKLDYFGNLFLARAIQGTSTVDSLAIDPRGNIVATGTFHGTADFDPSAGTANLTTGNATGAAYAWRLNSTGMLAWARGFQASGSIEAPAVAFDGAGNVYVAGRFTGIADLDPSDTGKAQVAAGSAWTPFVVKLGMQGQYVWGKTARVVTQVAGAENVIRGIGYDTIGNVYLAGSFAGTLDFDPGNGTSNLKSSGNAADGFVWKLDSAGNLKWARGFGGTGPEVIADLFVDKAGNTYTAGTFTGVGDFDPSSTGTVNLVSGSGESDGFVLKLTPQGTLAYARVLGGGISTTKPTAIFADGAGNIAVAGTLVGAADLNPGKELFWANGGNGSGFVVRLTPGARPTPGPVNSPVTGVTIKGPYTIDEGEGLTVEATAVDFDNDPLKFTWDLNGDGLFGDAIGPKVTLTAAQMKALGLEDGTGVARTIRVRVRDFVNLAGEATASLTIRNLPPTAKLKAPETSPPGVRPQLTVVQAGDIAKADRMAGMRYSYDFNDDGVWDLGDGATYAGSVAAAQLKVPAAFVPTSGPLAVRVRVFDKDGGYVDRTAIIDVQNAAPTAQFAMVGIPVVGRPVTFRFTNSNDAPQDKEAGFTYAYDFNGDGTYEVTGTKPTATYTFTYMGIFTVHGAIIDQGGAFTKYTLTVNVTV